MKKNLFFITLFFMLALISCKNNEIRTGISDSIKYNADEHINAISSTNNDMQQAIDTDIDNNAYEKDFTDTEYFDFIDEECWIIMVKGTIEWEKEYEPLMDVDSAIKKHADNVIPADSIRKWWNEYERSDKKQALSTSEKIQ